MSHTFRLTYDYLCPFARIANETVVAALEDGADWDVTFHPFSLSQVHIDEHEPAVWERPLGSPGTRGTRAHAWAIAVAAADPDQFLAFHRALFAARLRPAEAFREQLHGDEYAALGFEERTGLMIDAEWSAREQRKLARRLSAAKLRYANASLENIDFAAPRKLNRQQVLSLGSCAWIGERHNLLLLGPTETPS